MAWLRALRGYPASPTSTPAIAGGTQGAVWGCGHCGPKLLLATAGREGRDALKHSDVPSKPGETQGWLHLFHGCRNTILILFPPHLFIQPQHFSSTSPPMFACSQRPQNGHPAPIKQEDNSPLREDAPSSPALPWLLWSPSVSLQEEGETRSQSITFQLHLQKWDTFSLPSAW